MDKKINLKTICYIAIIAICVIALSYGVYYQLFIKPNTNIVETPSVSTDNNNFDELFDNQLHLQNYTGR